MKAPVVDGIDRLILGVVVEEGRATLQSVAGRAQLGPSATADRLRRLEKSVIRGYSARLDSAKLGFPLEALVDVDLPAGADGTRFESTLRDTPQVVEALHATGEHDYLLRVRCADTEELHETVRRLKADCGASRTRTSVVLNHVLPLRQRLPD